MTQPWGKNVLITGGAMGMGRELAFLFGREGAHVVLWDMNEEELEKTVTDVKDLGAVCRGYVVDISDVAKCKEARDKVHEDEGPIDILVNNAGIVSGGHLLDVPLEDHHKTIDVNVNAVITCTYLFLPDMIDKCQGHIINLASAGGLMGVAGLTSYCASKFAVVGFTESLRMELRKMKLKGIRTTTVCPSVVSTGMFEGMGVPKMSGMMSPKRMARSIYVGMKKNKSYVKEPFMVNTILLNKALMPAENFYAMSESMGVHTAIDSWTGREKK